MTLNYHYPKKPLQFFPFFIKKLTNKNLSILVFGKNLQEDSKVPELHFVKSESFFRTKGDIDCRAYNVYAKTGVFGDKSFAFLYIDIDYFTIAWNGFLDFSVIEKTILKDLPKALFPHLNRISPLNSIIKANFTFSEDTDDGYDVLVERDYNDNDSVNSQKFDALISSKWQKVLYTRYDVINHQDTHNRIEYSFTAENAHHPRIKHEFCELAIKQPIKQKTSDNLFKWIYNSHSERSYYTKHLNIDMVKDEFDRLIYE